MNGSSISMFWSAKTYVWRDARKAENPGGICIVGYRIWNKNILVCAESAYFNKEMRDKFDIYGQDAGNRKKKQQIRPTK